MPLTDSEKARRASEADRILSDPLLKDAFDEIERQAIEDMLDIGRVAIGAEDDRKRREIADRVNTIRLLRARLREIITDGVRAAQQPQSWA